ncbi:hypothetical protein [Mycobacterium sp. NPDC004974]
MRGDTLAAEFVARGRLPSTPGEWFGVLTFFAVIGTTFALMHFWVGRRGSARLGAQEARLRSESAQFRSQWPAQQLWQAPYADLEAEAERCWRIIFVLEQRRDSDGGGRRGDFDAQIAALRGWITTVVNAMNAVTSRAR